MGVKSGTLTLPAGEITVVFSAGAATTLLVQVMGRNAVVFGDGASLSYDDSVYPAASGYAGGVIIDAEIDQEEADPGEILTFPSFTGTLSALNGHRDDAVINWISLDTQ